jgi:hypothetical protein
MALDAYLSSYAIQPLVIESDRSGLGSISVYPWPTVPTGVQGITLGANDSRAIIVLNNYALNGYLVWPNTSPLPINATILYNRPVVSVINVPPNSLTEVHLSDLIYDNGKLFAFKSL